MVHYILITNNLTTQGGIPLALTSDDLQAIAKLLEPIKADILDIQLTLENETNRNIKIIAEGHAILNRRLDEALKVTSEQALLLLKVNSLENEVRRIKEQLHTA